MTTHRPIGKTLAASATIALLMACSTPSSSPTQAGEWAPNPPNPKAPYPAESFAAREQGTVLLRVQTTPAGRPTIVEVKQSSGYSRLDRSAVETVRKWQFKPTPDDGTEVGREVPIGFAIIH
ncbi:energy transducer TonB [Variovorax sp. KK3]|uniref:energy transducer TonB n=2 Tax=Variovorax sp. KK3 TaxID=1855728 RepID=UPI003AAB11D5